MRVKAGNSLKFCDKRQTVVTVILQKKVNCSVFRLTFNDHTNRYIESIAIFTVSDIYSLEVSFYVYNTVESFPHSSSLHKTL